MSWRTVVVSRRSKLETKLNYLVIRDEKSETKIFLDEISVLLLETTEISLTCALLEELISRKVSIIICDHKRNPLSQIVSLHGSYDSSARIKSQIAWTDELKQIMWTEIIKEKIRNQSLHLNKHGLEESKLLMEYYNQVELGDVTNREGHAAKVYFNALWGKSFSRSQDNFTNAALNYGYSILLSCVNREITSLGYITQLGLFHDNVFNHFNLGCDLMEPWRPIIDYKVSLLIEKNEFEKEDKLELIGFLNEKVRIDSSLQYVLNGIKIYCRSVFDAMDDGDISKIKFFRYEF